MYPRDCEAPCTSGTYVPHFGKELFQSRIWNNDFSSMFLIITAAASPAGFLCVSRPLTFDGSGSASADIGEWVCVALLLRTLGHSRL
jgi:hypothetical protein